MQGCWYLFVHQVLVLLVLLRIHLGFGLAGHDLSPIIRYLDIHHAIAFVAFYWPVCSFLMTLLLLPS